jgi:membrane protein
MPDDHGKPSDSHREGSGGYGQHASRPAHIPPRGWKQIAGRVWRNLGSHNASLISAGVALFALLATFPALNVIVTIYALLASPSQVLGHVEPLSDLLPEQAFSIIENQLVGLAQQGYGTINLALFGSIAFGLWSARKGAAAVITACNVAYGEKETRPLWLLIVVSLVFTIIAILSFVILGLTVIFMPLALDALPLGNLLSATLHVLRWPILALIFVLALQAVYRFAPNRADAKWRWVSWGAVIATVLWIGISILFSLYVQHFGNYNKTYGAIGSVIILIMWFYISAFSILLGAEINAETEHQTLIDSTTGEPKPLGQRGAYVADTKGSKDE